MGLDPLLVKAIVWRQSRFDPKSSEPAGERGLMQVSETAAGEWATEKRIDNFRSKNYSIPEKISKPARGICSAPCNIGT